MKTTSKLKAFLIIFFIAIFVVIIARHFIGLHFKKKFSARPAPGVIVSKVEKSLFYKSIETFGTAIAQSSKVYRVQKDNIAGNLNIENRFVKKGEIIIALKDGKNIIADFGGKVGKREIAQGVLGSNSLIITLDDLKKIVIYIKIPENYVGILKPGLKPEIINCSLCKKLVYTCHASPKDIRQRYKDCYIIQIIPKEENRLEYFERHMETAMFFPLQTNIDMLPNRRDLLNDLYAAVGISFLVIKSLANSLLPSSCAPNFDGPITFT